MSKLIPIEDHVLIEPIEEENKSASGIILPESNKEKPSKGKVIAVGAGRILDNGQRAPMDIKEGDVVYFTKYSPDELEIGKGADKKKYLVVKHNSILAKE